MTDWVLIWVDMSGSLPQIYLLILADLLMMSMPVMGNHIGEEMA